MDIRRIPRKLALTLGGAVALTAAIAGGGYAITQDDDASERPIPTADLEQAEKAALEETGGGTVTGTEVDDEESKYEVEVTLDDGTQVDVQLDADFAVVGTDADGSNDDDSGDD